MPLVQPLSIQFEPERTIMNRIMLAFVTAASLLSALSIMTTAANAQVGVQVGPQDRDHDRDRARAPGVGVTVGEPRHCHTVTITERHDGRAVTRTERRCD
jgi:hypothetical protein